MQVTHVLFSDFQNPKTYRVDKKEAQLQRLHIEPIEKAENVHNLKYKHFYEIQETSVPVEFKYVGTLLA